MNKSVMSMVEREIAKNPDVTGKVLYDKAVKIDSSIKKLSRRQFHASYPLQVRRRANAAGKGSRKKATKRRAGTTRKTTKRRAGTARKTTKRAARKTAKSKSGAATRSRAPKAAPKRKTRRSPRRSVSTRRRGAAANTDAVARDRVRAVLLAFASDLAGAEARKDVVRVLSAVDGYVDEILQG